MSGALRQFKASKPDNETIDDLRERIGVSRDYYMEQLSHIWVQLLHIANYIDQFPIENERDAEIKILRKQLTMNEKVMLFLFVPLFGDESDLIVLNKSKLIETLSSRIITRLPHSLINAHESHAKRNAASP